MNTRRPRGFSAYPPGELLAPAAGEGVAWLGRAPWAEAGPLFRLSLSIARALLRLGGVRIRLCGAEHLPAGAALLIGAPHRRYIDALIVGLALPPAPRVWALAIGPTVVGRHPLRSWFLRRAGGILPVWRGSSGIETHVVAAGSVAAAGARFVIMPEGGIAGPTDQLAEFRPGAAIIARRTAMRVVPMILRIVGRHWTLELLPTRHAADDPTCPAGEQSPNDSESRAQELRWARAWSERLAGEMEAVWRQTIAD